MRRLFVRERRGDPWEEKREAMAPRGAAEFGGIARKKKKGGQAEPRPGSKRTLGPPAAAGLKSG